MSNNLPGRSPSLGTTLTRMLWNDKWSQDTLQQVFPELHSYAKDDSISIKSFCSLSDVTGHFHLPLSLIAYEQLTQLQSILPHLNSEENDKWICNGNSRQYSSMRMYEFLMGDDEGHPIFKLIWDSSSRLKHKIFFSLVAHSRVNTRAMLKRKGMHVDDPVYPNCNQKAEETLMHQLWDCNFAWDCCNTLIPRRKRGTSVYEDTKFAMDQLPKNVSLK